MFTEEEVGRLSALGCYQSARLLVESPIEGVRDFPLAFDPDLPSFEEELPAKAFELHDLLNSIYNLQIEAFEPGLELELTLNEILAAHARNNKLLEEDENANKANATVRQRLYEMKKTARTLELESIVRETLSQYGLAEVIPERPRLAYELLRIPSTCNRPLL
jgi:hypothetical protein